MERLKVTINGKEYLADSDKTILEVINDNNIAEIPTLCHDKRLTPYGSCFLCVVEVEGLNRLIPSCSSVVRDGMVITTNNEKIKSSRKTALDLLLSNHYADCVAPCKNTCPAGVDVQGYISLIANKKYREAIQLIKENNPLPLICSRICVRECELTCRRNEIDEPVAINFLKRYAADIDIEDPWKPETKKKNNKKIAVIGGGPSGLSCAYFLTLKGYSVTIFEELPHLGGMLRYGIPEYRLPKETLDREIDLIIGLGIEVKKNIEFGKDITIEDLNNEYDAVYLAIGAQKAKKFGIPGENSTEGVLWGIDFLRNAQLKGVPELNGNVVIVGGGNTAIDAARTALRCKAKNVKIIYRRSIKEMPAHPAEIEAAREEGIAIEFLTNPLKILNGTGRLNGIECIRMKLEKDKSGGRPRPVAIPGSEFTVKCDYLISAIGQDIDTNPLKTIEGLELSKWNTIETNPDTLETTYKKVFAGGDAVSGPLTAINAIAQGKTAAQSIDHFIKNGNTNGKNHEFLCRKESFGDIPNFEYSDYKKLKRNKMPELNTQQRIKNFEEVDLGFSCKQASNETTRCLECGCIEEFDCILRKYASDFDVDISKYAGDVRKYKIDDRHPLIVLDANKCINCGKCVRTCSEILEVSAIDFVYRGFQAVVKPAMEKALAETNCISCGNCIDVCPTGAISEKMPFRISGTLKKENHRTICDFCSIGCNLNYKVIYNDLFYVSNSTKEIIDSHNKGYLCIKGRFGYRYLLDENRLQKPAIKSNGLSKEVEWNEAINYSAKKIKQIINKYGPGSVAVFGSPKMSNEELYLLQKFARVGIKTNNIASFSNLLYGNEMDALDEMIGLTVSTTTMDEISKADIIVVINSDLYEENLILELKIKEAQKKGAKLILINSAEIKLTKFAQLWIDTLKGTNTVLLNGLMKELLEKRVIDIKSLEYNTAGFAEFKEMLSNIDLKKVSVITGVRIDRLKEVVRLIEKPETNIVFVYNIDSHKEKSKNDLKAIANFLLLTNRINKTGNGVIILRDFSNSSGLLDMGVSTQYLPGYVKYSEKDQINRIGQFWNVDLNEVFNPVNLTKKMIKEEIKAMLIFGEDPLIVNENLKYFNGIEFLLVQDIFNTSTAQEADVVLPLSTYIEQDGTYTSCDLRIQKANQIIEPITNYENWEIITRLAENFNSGFNYKLQKEIFNEIRQINRFYDGCEIGEFWGEKYFTNGLLATHQKVSFSIYDIDISTINPEKPILLCSENYFKTKIK